MGNPRGVRRDFQALEKRRLTAVKLFGEQFNNSEISRRLKVCNQTVSRWRKQYAAGGKSALHKAGRAGRKPLLSADDQQRLVELLQQGPERLGYETPLWTCWRVAHLIDKEFGISYHSGHVWKLLRALNWSVQRPVGRALERDEDAIREWKSKRWPAIKKKACQEGRTIVFIDESGLSQRPHRCRTWAPRGETPVLQYHFNWKTISVAAAMTLWNFYFQIFEKAIAKEQVAEFLAYLVQQLPCPLLIGWDRLPAHRSRLVAEFVALLEGQIELEYLPAYAAELNPVEYLWGHWKHHQLPNVCPKDLWQLNEGARRTLRRLRRRPRLITAFWKQASLFD
jgi:transposase